MLNQFKSFKMNTGFSLIFTLINCFGCMTNVSTVIYILKNFDVSVHVFTLVFVDSLISTSCSFMATIIRGFVMSNLLTWGFNNCTVLFLSTFLPTHFGGILTCLVAAIRLILAKKSAQNIQVSNKKVSIWSFSTFLFFVALSGTFYAVNLILNIPFVVIVEICKNERRPVGTFNSLASRTGIIFYIFSIILDILVIRFIRKTVLPETGQNNQLQTISEQVGDGENMSPLIMSSFNHICRVRLTTIVSNLI